MMRDLILPFGKSSIYSTKPIRTTKQPVLPVIILKSSRCLRGTIVRNSKERIIRICRASVRTPVTSVSQIDMIAWKIV